MNKAEDYIIEHTRNCSNQSKWGVETPNKSIIYVQPWLTPDQARMAVEIAREEMIEKACEYLDGLIEILNDRGHGLKKELIIGGLKQAMKDE